MIEQELLGLNMVRLGCIGMYMQEKGACQESHPK